MKIRNVFLKEIISQFLYGAIFGIMFFVIDLVISLAESWEAYTSNIAKHLQVLIMMPSIFVALSVIRFPVKKVVRNDIASIVIAVIIAAIIIGLLGRYDILTTE